MPFPTFALLLALLAAPPQPDYVRVAEEFADSGPISPDDLVSEGCILLVTAYLPKYDLSRGSSLKSFISNALRIAITGYLTLEVSPEAAEGFFHEFAGMAVFLLAMVITNISLAIFNLIPLPPLDGFNVAQGLLATFRTRWAYEWGNRLDRLATYGPILLLALLSLGWFTPLNPLGWIIGQPVSALLGLLLGT